MRKWTFHNFPSGFIWTRGMRKIPWTSGSPPAFQRVFETLRRGRFEGKQDMQRHAEWRKPGTSSSKKNPRWAHAQCADWTEGFCLVSSQYALVMKFRTGCKWLIQDPFKRIHLWASLFLDWGTSRKADLKHPIWRGPYILQDEAVENIPLLASTHWRNG